MNAAKYGKSLFNSREIVVLWDDPRDVYAIVIRFKSTIKDLKKEDVKLQYWQGNWPKFREPVGAGSSGWGPIDDFYNGQWRDAKFDLETDEDVWLLRFRPLDEEFPDIGNFKAQYRRTLKVRVVSSKDLPEVKSFETYTDSIWRKIDVSVEWGCGNSGGRIWDGTIEVFNGELI
ncbi:MAG: hypothetical protein QW797_06940, partial [Thermoproteota archaeon]